MTQGEFLLQHKYDFVLILLMHPLHIQLAKDDLLLVDYPALEFYRMLQFRQTL